MSARERSAAARQAWLDSGGTLTGAELGPMFNRKARWGRDRIAEARNGNGTAAPAANGTNGNGGAPSTATPPTAQRQTDGTSTARRPAAAAARRKAEPVPLQLLVVTVAAVALVTAVCAVVSYVHVRDLARLVGMGTLAGWLPLGVDGLVVACSCSLIVDRNQGRAGHSVAWLGVVLGLATTLTANVIAVDPGLVPIRAVRWVLAGYAPAALGVSGHLLFRMLGDRR